ncbi:hypothetical protein Lalb_Chr17g0346531 [Lupinus albus]|uniref:Uncharacterized protein n=1 Tax=Lupinus albus TaxID=3870 RepID=A0A6A4P6V4_LUPAL|nr:hypothetical protein Lalb_Chr17g0346531 [Lupinus albus]
MLVLVSFYLATVKINLWKEMRSIYIYIYIYIRMCGLVNKGMVMVRVAMARVVQLLYTP